MISALAFSLSFMPTQLCTLNLDIHVYYGYVVLLSRILGFECTCQYKLNTHAEY